MCGLDVWRKSTGIGKRRHLIIPTQLSKSPNVKILRKGSNSIKRVEHDFLNFIIPKVLSYNSNHRIIPLLSGKLFTYFYLTRPKTIPFGQVMKLANSRSYKKVIRKNEKEEKSAWDLRFKLIGALIIPKIHYDAQCFIIVNTNISVVQKMYFFYVKSIFFYDLTPIYL